jgi:hypothetical protein
MLCLLAGLAATGCGGSDDDPPTKAAFLTQGNELCKKSTAQRNVTYNERIQESDSGITTDEIVTDIVLPSISETTEELEALGAPKGDEDQIQAIVTGIEDAVTKSEKKVEKEPDNFEEPFIQVSNLARSYGLVDCAEML